MLEITRVTVQEMARSTAIMLAAILASCAALRQPAVQTSASKPTVSYVYSDDQGLVEATRQAESYCAQYSAWPTSSDIVTQSDGRHVTFFCDQPRTVTSAPATVVAPAAQQVVSYPYADDRGLIEAANQAQRYCMGFNANARSTVVVNNANGSRTLTFECVRM
jgi:Tfp pilus assembly protein FimT